MSVDKDQRAHIGTALVVIGIALLFINLINMIIYQRPLSYQMPLGLVIAAIGMFLKNVKKQSDEG